MGIMYEMSSAIAVSENMAFAATGEAKSSKPGRMLRKVEPNGAQGRVGPFGNTAKVAVVWETCHGVFTFHQLFVTWGGGKMYACRYTLVTTEGIDGPRASMQSSLADEERRQTHKCL